MKTGKSLVQLATEIERQANARKDYVAPTASTALIIHPTESTQAKSKAIVNYNLEGVGEFGINDLAHRQIGDHVGIPAKYYDRLRDEAPALLATNVNHWLTENPSNRLIRSLDGNVRAFLSDKYRPLENHDLGEAVIPALLENQLEVISCELTERRLYIKAVDKKVVREIKGNRIVDGHQVAYDTLSPTITVSNSEVGQGALSVEFGFFTHECENMALFREKSLRKYHVGGKHELADGLATLLSEKTKRLSDAATWAQVTDVVKNGLNIDGFTKAVTEIATLRDQRITGDITKVVELASRSFEFQETERKSVLRHLIEGGDLTRYGLLNAVTRTAEDIESYDRATDFERIGGQIIELPANDWKRIAEAA